MSLTHLLARQARLQPQRDAIFDGTRPWANYGQWAARCAGLAQRLRRAGLQQPLPFAPYSGWELFSAEDAERGIRNAAARWRGGDRQWGEGDSDAIRLALRGRDPFADAASLREFARITGLVFGAVTRGEPIAIDIDNADVPDDDAEDAA